MQWHASSHLAQHGAPPVIYFVRAWYFQAVKVSLNSSNRFRASMILRVARRRYRSTTEGRERALVAMETLAQRVDCGVPQVFYGLDDCRRGRDSKNRYTDLDTRLSSIYPAAVEGTLASLLALANFSRLNLCWIVKRKDFIVTFRRNVPRIRIYTARSRRKLRNVEIFAIDRTRFSGSKIKRFATWTDRPIR